MQNSHIKFKNCLLKLIFPKIFPWDTEVVHIHVFRGTPHFKPAAMLSHPSFHRDFMHLFLNSSAVLFLEELGAALITFYNVTALTTTSHTETILVKKGNTVVAFSIVYQRVWTSVFRYMVRLQTYPWRLSVTCQIDLPNVCEAKTHVSHFLG